MKQGIVGVLMVGVLVIVYLMMPDPPAPAAGTTPASAAHSASASVGEAIAVLRMINTGCRLYEGQHFEPPADLDAIVSKGYISLASLNGHFLKPGDYAIDEIGDLGYPEDCAVHGLHGVTAATISDSGSGQTYQLVWNPETRRYQIAN